MGDSRDDIVLEVKDLRTYFFTQRGVGKAVDGVSFHVERGETLGLVGESGCGKSITALSIIGLHPQPAARIVGGEILFRGEDLLRKSPQELRAYRGKRIAIILQDPMTALNPVFRVGEQIVEPLRLHQGLRGRALRERTVELLEMLRIPAAAHRLDDYPHQFSGGMRQRVVGAIALSCEPELIIADEPTTSLDVTVQAAYLRLLREIQEQTGVAILFITHDFGVVAKMCDRVAVMYAGKVVETAPTWELFDRPQHPYTEALLRSVPDLRAGAERLASIDGQPPSIFGLPPGCPFAARCPHVMEHCRERYPPQVEIGASHRTSCWLPPRHGTLPRALRTPGADRRQAPHELLEAGVSGPANDGVLLRLEAVRKHYPLRGALPWSQPRGYVRAVDGVSLEIRPEETVSLVGESGCGKTTTAKMVLRLELPTAGRISYEGRDVAKLTGPALKRYRASVQAVFQDPWSSLNPRMRAGDIVGEPLLLNEPMSRRERRERVADLFLAVGLEPATARNFPHEFSGGMRQRLAVARALALHPSLIVLDEPVSALDVSIRAQMMNLLKSLQGEHGMAYLLIAHDLATVRYLSHRVAVMYLGEIVEQAPAEALFADPLHPYTQALLSAALPARPGEASDEIVLGGEIPSPTAPPSGCRFHTRCPFAMPRCKDARPALRELAPGHHAACHLYDERAG